MIKVNGQTIPQAAVDFELSRLVQFYSQHIPEDQIRAQMDDLRSRAIDQAIGAKLLMDEANRLDIAVPDDEVAARIEDFKRQAGGEEELGRILRAQGSNLVEFGEQIRRGRKIDKLVERITSETPDPTEDEVMRHYEEHKDEYTKTEQAQAQHILISPKGKTGGSKAEALESIRKIRERVLAGEDFSHLAAAYSDCPSGKSNGGSLGWFGRGAMVPEFDKAVFSMEDGEISDIIETQFGYHIVKKLGHQDASTPDYDDIREDARDFLRHAARGEAVSAYVSELREKAKVEIVGEGK